jgi:hypothetical protein
MLMRPGLRPECGFSIWLLFWLLCCVFSAPPPPSCVFGFGSALLCCVPVPGGVVRSCVSVYNTNTRSSEDESRCGLFD